MEERSLPQPTLYKYRVLANPQPKVALFASPSARQLTCTPNMS